MRDDGTGATPNAPALLDVLDGRGKDAPLAVSAEQFRALGHELVDRIAELLESMPDRQLTPGAPPTPVRSALLSDRSLPEQGADPGTVLRTATDLLFEHSLFNGHPRFFGYIWAPPSPIGILGDMLASAVNANVGAWKLSPMATEIEAQVVRWIAQLIGYPDQCGGVLVSGGNMANLVCFLAARASHAGWNVRQTGIAAEGAPRLRVYCSAETHTWVQKATDLSGLGTDAIRWIPTDAELRIDVGALRVQIDSDVAAGDRPLMVIGTAGSVSTGAVDPLFELAALCRDLGIWFHVDGAYGGFAAAVSDVAPDLAGLAEADSVAVDPHKWLYAPLEAGCALVRDAEALRAAFAYHPPYYNFGVEAINYFDYGPQNSRGFRALKVWLALNQAGRAGYQRMIRGDIALSERLYANADAHPELEALTQQLSIATFRYVPPDLQPEIGTEGVERYLDKLNHELLERLERCGEAFVSNAVVRGRFALRACIVNFHTTMSDIDALVEIVARYGRETDRALRSLERSQG